MSGPTHIDLEPPQQPTAKPVEPPPPRAPAAPDSRRPLPTTRQFGAIAGVILIAAVVAFAAVYLLPVRFDEGPGRIVILLVAGLVALTLLLYLGTVIHRTLGVGSSKGALGMPDGSIRALIALSLVLMFAIIGVTVLYAGMGSQEEVVSNGITAAQINDLENVQIISISVVDPAASPGTERYNVTVHPEISQAGHDFGLQLLTTVSTLVVAVAGFYFGSRAVAQGSKAAVAAIASQQTPPDGGAGGGTDTTGGDTGSDDGGGGTEELAENEVIGAVEEEAGDDDEGPDEADAGEAAAAGGAAGGAAAGGAGGAAAGAGAGGAGAAGAVGAGGAAAGGAASGGAAGGAGTGAAGGTAGTGGAGGAGAGGAGAGGSADTATNANAKKKDKP
jgi:hypothetical protein